MTVWQWIVANWPSIVVVALFVIVCIVLWKLGYKKRVKHMLYVLVAEAEQKFGSKTGEIKYAYVVERIYRYLPAILRVFFSEKEIGEYIDEAVQQLKALLDTGADLLTYEDERLIGHK